MKIILFGASGSGTTTLGKAIEKKTNFTHLDVDDYYWKKTEPPFQEKVTLTERNRTLERDFKSNTIISGSLVSWAKGWESSFDLAVFIQLDHHKRMERLKSRENQRYGEKLVSDKNLQQISKAFLEWASQYENPHFNGRSLKVHNAWVAKLNCKILRIDGGLTLKYNTELLLAEINKTLLSKLN